ncbi:hypothetical protein DZF91_14740 [Actinomadura logoneensis]|uniref:Uncharacterized protein n=1 Tax=Actinomadura logoneensis TaxID=2293572 RepID=A0A372JLJ4_9ACTN|nr:hypothetical protein DZF91_14740 [Actinomadura logoneensis]
MIGRRVALDGPPKGRRTCWGLDVGEHAVQILLGLQQSGLGEVLGGVEVALGTGQMMECLEESPHGHPFLP